MNYDAGKNIINAFKVVKNTYKNVSKLHDHFKTYRGKYRLVIDNFVRWRSDVDYEAWLINGFYFLFQCTEDQQFENNGWFDGPLFAVHISFWHECEEPTLRFIKYEYSDMASWQNHTWSIGSHGQLNDPFLPQKGFRASELLENGIRQILITDKEISRKYWSLTKVQFVEMPLLLLTKENCDQTLEREFDRLRSGGQQTGSLSAEK
ncbi:MAG: hypothetical protein FWD58_07970 [Firmicutes bacterium]|nr:hypothetical protein [Bacillota bacterium]